MYEELLERANLPMLFYTRFQDIVVLMYKVKYDLVPDNVSSLCVSKDSAHSLPNNDFSPTIYSWRNLQSSQRQCRSPAHFDNPDLKEDCENHK